MSGDLLEQDDLDLDALNRLLGAGTHLLSFTLEAEGARFNVRLTLIDKAGAKHTLRCLGVQNLELLPEGDALTRPMRLLVEDLREDKLTGIRFSVEEQDDSLFLHCAELAFDEPAA